MNGTAVIVLGFISFGVLHTTTDNFEPWQWFGRFLLPYGFLLIKAMHQAFHYHGIDDTRGGYCVLVRAYRIFE